MMPRIIFYRAPLLRCQSVHGNLKRNQRNLSVIHNYNLSFYINNSTLYIQNMTCGQDFLQDTFQLNMGINFSLACN